MALFEIAKTWKWSKYLPVVKQIGRNNWCSQPWDGHQALDEWRSRSPKVTHCAIPLIWHSQNGKIRDGEQISGCQRLRMEGKREKTDKCDDKGEAGGLFVVTEQLCILVVTESTRDKIVENYMHTHKCMWNRQNLNKLWTVPMSTPWFWYRPMVICYHWDNWVKGAWDPSVLFL